MTQAKRVNKIIKFARRIAGREGNSLAWHGDLSAEHDIAALKIVRHCLLFPECTPPSILSLFKARQVGSRNDEHDSGITWTFPCLKQNSKRIPCHIELLNYGIVCHLR